MNTIHHEYISQTNSLSEEQAILQSRYVAFVLSWESDPDFDPELYLWPETIIVWH
jgi:hypothetical protein